MESLPTEMLWEISKHLDHHDKKNLRSVCRRLAECPFLLGDNYNVKDLSDLDNFYLSRVSCKKVSLSFKWQSWDKRVKQRGGEYWRRNLGQIATLKLMVQDSAQCEKNMKEVFAEFQNLRAIHLFESPIGHGCKDEPKRDFHGSALWVQLMGRQRMLTDLIYTIHPKLDIWPVNFAERALKEWGHQLLTFSIPHLFSPNTRRRYKRRPKVHALGPQIEMTDILSDAFSEKKLTKLLDMLEGLPNLRKATLPFFFFFEPSSPPSLRVLQNLTHLKIDCACYSSYDLDLPDLPNLVAIDLTPICYNRGIFHGDLENCKIYYMTSRVYSRGLDRLFAKMLSLEVIVIAAFGDETKRLVEAVVPMKNLRCLQFDLEHLTFGENFVVNILNEMKGLVQLVVNSWPEEVPISLLKLPLLEDLCVGQSYINESQLKVLAQNCPRLRNFFYWAEKKSALQLPFLDMCDAQTDINEPQLLRNVNSHTSGDVLPADMALPTVCSCSKLTYAPIWENQRKMFCFDRE